MPDNYPPLVSSVKLGNVAAVTRGDGLQNHSAIKIQAGLRLRAMHESPGNTGPITNLFACVSVDPGPAPPSPWRAAVMINSNQICSREGLPRSLLHIMRSGEEN